LLKVRDHFGYDGLGNREVLSCFGHAAALHDSDEDIQLS
jgi:hypothetical protein